jgi:hypothetical protein
MESTLVPGSPEYRQTREAMPQLPGWANEPLLKKEQDWESSWNPILKQQRDREAQVSQQFDTAHPIIGGVARGVSDTIQGMTSPANLAMLAAAPESKIISGFFATQAAKGAYDNAEQAYQAWRIGLNGEAAKYLTESGLSAVIAGLAGRSALKGAFPVDTGRPSITEPKTSGGESERARLGAGARPPVEFPPDTPVFPLQPTGAPRLQASTPGEAPPNPQNSPGPVNPSTAIERTKPPTQFAPRPEIPADKGVIVDEQGNALPVRPGLPAPRDTANRAKPIIPKVVPPPAPVPPVPPQLGSAAIMATPTNIQPAPESPQAAPAPIQVTTPAAPVQQPQAPGTAEARPVVQASTDPAQLRQSAQQQQPALEQMAGQVAAAVPGAEVVGPRVKTAESIKNKDDRGKAPETNIDNLAVRVVASSPDDVPAIQQVIERQLPVASKDTIDSNGLNIPQYAIQTGKPGEPNQVSELQVIPGPATAKAMKETDPLYAKQKEALAEAASEKPGSWQQKASQRVADDLGAQLSGILDKAKAQDAKATPKKPDTPQVAAMSGTAPMGAQPASGPKPLVKGTLVTLKDGTKGTIKGGNANEPNGGRWIVTTHKGSVLANGKDLKTEAPAEAVTPPVQQGQPAPGAPRPVGKPLMKRIEQIKALVAKGQKVVIFSSEADNPTLHEALHQVGLGGLPVTNIKGPDFSALLDNEVNVPTNADEPMEIPEIAAGKAIYVDFDGTLFTQPGGVEKQEAKGGAGEPIRAYHGTAAQFEGAPRTDGLGAHFAPERKLAEDFSKGSSGREPGRVIEAELNIKNPLRIKDHGFPHSDAEATVEDFIKQGVLPKEFSDGLVGRLVKRSEELQKGIDQTLPRAEYKKQHNDAYQTANNEELVKVKKYLQSKGYDGLVYDNTLEGHGDSYVAFDQRQINVKGAPANEQRNSPEQPANSVANGGQEEAQGAIQKPAAQVDERQPGQGGREDGGRVQPVQQGVEPARESAVKPGGKADSQKEVEPKFKHGNTQADIPPGSDAGKALARMRKSILPEDLAGDGLVNDSHITVRYGIDAAKENLANMEKIAAEAKQKKSDLGSTFYSGFGDPALFARIFPNPAERIADWLSDAPTSGDTQRAMMRETRGEMDRKVAIAIHKLKDASKDWRTRSRDDSMKFWNAVEAGKVDSLPAKDRALANLFKAGFDNMREQLQALKPEVLQDYIENYFPHVWERPSQVSATIKAMLNGKKPFAGKASFLKQRTIPTMQDGIDLGFKPISWNPVDSFLTKYAEMAQFLMGHQTLQVMKNAGTARQVRVGNQPPEGWTQLDDRIGTVHSYDDDGHLYIRGHYYAPADAARIFNNFVSRGMAGRSTIYDTLNWANQNLNALQLGISAFHASTTSINAVTSDVALGIQQLAEGKPLRAGISLATGAAVPVSIARTLINGTRLMKEYLEPGSYAKMRKEAEALTSAGGRIRQNTIEIKPLQKIINAWRNGAVLEGLTPIPGAILRATVAPVMEFYVPRIKLGAFYAMAHNILDSAQRGDWSDGLVRSRMQEAWDSIDNRFGQVVYDNLFWHKGVRDALNLATRSVGWNYGSYRELGGAVADVARQAGRAASGQVPRVTPRLAFGIALPLVSALFGGILTYLWTGKRPDEWKDYFYPKTANGERHSIPGYMKDVFSFQHAPGKTVLNKMAPIWEATSEAIENRDFYGTEIRHKDNPLMAQLGQFSRWAGSQTVPFAISGAEKLLQQRGSGPSLAEMLAEAKKHPGDVALAQLGFQPAPAFIQNSPALNMAREYNRDNRPPGTKTQEQSDHYKALDAVVEMYRSGDVDDKQIDRYVEKGVLSDKDVDKAARESDQQPIARAVQNLSIEQMLNVWEKASPDEREAMEPILARHERDIDKETDDDRREQLHAAFDKAMNETEQGPATAGGPII